MNQGRAAIRLLREQIKEQQEIIAIADQRVAEDTLLGLNNQTAHQIKSKAIIRINDIRFELYQRFGWVE